VFVEDVVDAYRAAALTTSAGAEAPVINIGARAQSTLGDVIHLVERCVGRQVRYVEGAYDRVQWPGDGWTADIGLAERVLGWQPTTRLEDGIRQTADWMMTNGHVDAEPRL
jgi:UDP-N-acetylglucosamine/UDP-N-acetylgalactosamine 4-epimerase